MFSLFGLMFFLAADGFSSGRIQRLSGSLFLTRHRVYFSAFMWCTLFTLLLHCGFLTHLRFVLLHVAILGYEDFFK